MKIEIVTIGDELLLGFTIDTNAAFLARALAAIGQVDEARKEAAKAVELQPGSAAARTLVNELSKR